jgi:hypothetical protein
MGYRRLGEGRSMDEVEGSELEAIAKVPELFSSVSREHRAPRQHATLENGVPKKELVI